MRRARRLIGGVLAGLLVSGTATLGGPTAAGVTPVAPGATPRARCGPGSTPETGMQGRVSAADVASGRAERGYACNMAEVSHFGNSGGYKVHRYVDAAGRECAYYDSTLLFPKDVLTAGQNRTGVYVLDMTDPAHPVKTDNLVTPAMLSPHESLLISAKRGLLMADMGYPSFNPGFVDIYDISKDCRHPVLLSSTPLGILGHESGLTPDGNTFWVTSTGGRTVVALDITNPALPVPLWIGNDWTAHGIRVSKDGTRLYIADTQDGLHILDVSEVQKRVQNPTVREISHLTWPDISIPQVAIPVTITGRPYLVEIDEFSVSFSSANFDTPAGAARIIDIADEKNPKVVSNIRLEVHDPQVHEGDELNDPGASSELQGYAGHYCAVPREDEPGIVACSFILSGLRVFDIRDPLHPKEIAYFNKPVKGTSPTDPPSSYAMSAAAFAPERGEIWYVDGNSGFWALRVTNGVWPFRPARAAPTTRPEPRVEAGHETRNGTLPATGSSTLPPLVGSALLAAALAVWRAARRAL